MIARRLLYIDSNLTLYDHSTIMMPAEMSSEDCGERGDCTARHRKIAMRTQYKNAQLPFPLERTDGEYLGIVQWW